MKYLAQIILFFAMTPAAAADKAAPIAVDPEFTEIKTLCVKNAKPELIKGFSVDAACECSVKRTLERLRNGDYKEKDPKARIEWFKRMYAMKLSKAEVDSDPHGIFDFNISVTETCIKELKGQK